MDSVLSFSSRHYFGCVQYFDMLHFHFYSVQYFLFICLEVFSLTHGFIVSILFSVQELGYFFYLSVTDFCFNSTVVREYTVFDFNYFKLIEVCFMVPDVVYLDICPWALGIMCILLMLGGVFCKCHQPISWWCY